MVPTQQHPLENRSRREERSESSGRAVLLARPCLPKLMERRELEVAKQRCAPGLARTKRWPEGDVCPEGDPGDGCPISACWLSQVSEWWRAQRSTQQRWRNSSRGLQLLKRPTDPGVVHLHPSLLLSPTPEEAASWFTSWASEGAMVTEG